MSDPTESESKCETCVPTKYPLSSYRYGESVCFRCKYNPSLEDNYVAIGSVKEKELRAEGNHWDDIFGDR